MQRRDNRTKVVISLDSARLGCKHGLEAFRSGKFDAIRFVYRQDHTSELCDFFAQHVAQDPQWQAGEYGIILDATPGERARVVAVAADQGVLELEFDDCIEWITAGDLAPSQIKLACDSALDQRFMTDQKVFFNQGGVVCRVLEVAADRVMAQVLQGGRLEVGSELHVASGPVVDLPQGYTRQRLQALTEKLEIDYLMVPAALAACDWAALAAQCRDLGQRQPRLLARLTDPREMERIQEWLNVADGVVLARHELGLAVDPATVPMICKEVTRYCQSAAKSVFVASETLASMRSRPSPTRAEVSDIANAVMDAVDGVILARDVIHGGNGLRALSLSEQIIADVESEWGRELQLPLLRPMPLQREFDAVSYYAYQTAVRVGAVAIACITLTGNTALRLASFHPNLPIYAVTFRHQTVRQLRVVRSVVPLLFEGEAKIDDILPRVIDQLRREKSLVSGQKIVFVTVSLSPMADKASNLFTVQRVV